MDNPSQVKVSDPWKSQIFRLVIPCISVADCNRLEEEKNGFDKLPFLLSFHCFGSNAKTNPFPSSGIICLYKSAELTWLHFLALVFAGLGASFAVDFFFPVNGVYND